MSVTSETLKDKDYVDAILAGRLDPQIILWGYARGIFPMGNPETGDIEWYCPDPRGIISLRAFHVPHNLRAVIRRGKFRVTINNAFERVMRACANREETWITDDIIRCYTELHRRGFAHSIETWLNGELVGGLYGVAIGGAFFGESMFHSRTDASKVALVALVQQLRQQHFLLLDIQFITAHLARFGAETIPRDDYLRRLVRALQKPCDFLRPNQQTIELT